MCGADIDDDGDGYTENQGDCDDGNAAVNPGAAEICNLTDDNCDGQNDEGVTSTFYADTDGDGYGTVSSSTQACSPPSGYVADNTDCDDTSEIAYPGASEICGDGLDQNCSGDDLLCETLDTDQDGFPDNATLVECSTGETVAVQSSGAGTLTELVAVDPEQLPGGAGKPKHMPYGLLDFTIDVAAPGSSFYITVYLPEAAPPDFTWVKYSQSSGWIDYGDHIIFSADRTQLTIHLIDGGIGDNDGVVNGRIADPSGLASIEKAAPPPSIDNQTGGGGGGGGCFMNALFY